jgi:hypothetical protein
MSPEPIPSPDLTAALLTPLSPPVQQPPQLTAPAPAPTAEPAPAPDAQAPAEGLEGVVGETVAAVSIIVKPAAAVAVASNFGFPLVLMVAVVLFLVIQTRVDRRDPRLRAALGSTTESLVPFEDEERL